ncbi:nitrate regulatory gene2 protein-like isoform X2 [Mercurialis annua]|uniref:nitrate regulatory gene2 protein-like isoform X2 n=1 Tax=Mercurialis annua TaxID=3986 RepID=UPI002160D6F7|nr:nitrate regulatory gene2 protein-like isoform X2 [Mercurialis annua]
MGCSMSKLDDEEAVQLCKDRKRFIKQAVEHRARFATGHLAYIQSMKRVSAALRDYIEGDEPREFLLDSFITPPFTPVKKTSSGFISISPKSFSQPAIHLGPNSTLKVNYLRSGGNQAVSVEERPQSPETIRLQAYSPVRNYGFDGYYGMQSSPMYSSFFSYSPNNRPNLPPPSPQTTQWDGFWNPFSSLDSYNYFTRSSLDHMFMDDDIRGLRQVREEEGIPDLEDETEHEEMDSEVNATEGQHKVNGSSHAAREEVLVEDVDEDDETDCESECECECENMGLQSKVELSRVQNTRQVEVGNQEMSIDKGGEEGKAETPAFTVYVNRRPTSMSEVIKDLEEQFTIACNSAKEVSSLLESSKALYSSASNELTAMKMLNPVALFRSASSRSSSSRFLINSSNSRDEGYESSSDFSEESCVPSGSHQSTLDRLYAWEKKLYEEVKSGERVRIAYEKKRMQLRNQDIKGEDPFVVDKTRLAIRDLYTQLQVSIHSAEAVSKRIEALRDEELQPQLLELIKGLSRMWKVMAECHQSQRQTLDAAKLLLAGLSSKLDAKRRSSMSIANPQRLARCFRSDTDTSKLPFSPRRSNGTFPMYGLCIQWSRFLDVIQELPVLDGLDFFSAGMGSLYAQQLRDDPTKASSRRHGAGLLNESGSNMELVQVGDVEDVMTAEKMAEVAIRVLCAGMSVAASSLTEFSISSAEGYAELVKQWENVRLPHSSGAINR